MEQKKDYSKTLLDSYQMGDISLSNRMGMSALTRIRADPKTSAPNDLMASYYAQRAHAGFILTEATAVSKVGNPFPGAPGIWTKVQAEGWKKVVDAVHEKGGNIVLQIWHAGRAAEPEKTGEPNIGPSAIPQRTINKEGKETLGHMPIEMTKEDIKVVIEQFKHSAILAKEVGFDGIQLHGANGFLVDEFIRDSSNQRTDEYGGSIENRVRFALEIIDVLISVFGQGRVGIKLSPVGRFQGMFDSTPIETYTYLLEKLNEKGIAFVEMTEISKYDGPALYIPGKEQIHDVAKLFRPIFKGTFITNQGHTPKTALEYVNNDWADLVTFGKLFISNPDLVDRVKNGWELNYNWNPSTFYIGNEKGYIDFPNYIVKREGKEKDTISG